MAGADCGPLALSPKFTPIASTDFWKPFSLEGYLAQSRYNGYGLDPASNNVLDFVDSP